MVTNNHGSTTYWKVLLPLGVLVAFWGVLGLIQMGHWGHGGFDTNNNGIVGHVEPEGPADRAGLQEADLIVAVGDATSEGWWKKPYPGGMEVGERQTLLVERDGQSLTVEIVWEPLSTSAKRHQAVEFLVTLAFLGFGLWALFVSSKSGGLLLAVFGLAYGMVNFRGPSFIIPEGAIVFVKSQLSLLYTAVLAHFLLAFPKPKVLIRTPTRVYLFYIPFVVYLAFGLVAGHEYPAFRGEYSWIATVTDFLYMILALAALVHSWFSMTRIEKRDSGLHWIPLGLAVAIGPFLILALTRMVAPEFGLPGEDYIPLLGIAIPAGLALAVVNNARFRCNNRDSYL